ncbi:DF family (seleno)protein [Naasia lichenicola]|uniref:Thioredoxin family protein n=1 Tax=Naasia lichenicola TaxID=2565933 RepID=A0A4S4FMK5_9MICO|nr:hypothetical protein [Naasia lichenicola]THG30655.1 hypothetical protein E6C64_08425 [Naasia lichenicola]THG31892.1 hypothetical protein E6C64_07570 [Naasia lichenicola]
MAVELLIWSGCPSHDDARTRLRETLDALGRTDEPIEERWVESEGDAAALGFIGSPTIRVDGVEVVPFDEGEPTGLTCRVYLTRAGKYSPLPDRDDLREGLERLLTSR